MLLGLVLLVIIYKIYNPAEYTYFPKCSFKELTGYKCPGCGSQRAIHALLNFKFSNAIKQNILLVLAMPYVALGFFLDSIKNPNSKILAWRKLLFGTKAIFIILILIVSFWIWRNTIYST